jgi:hypothetical protein
MQQFAAQSVHFRFERPFVGYSNHFFGLGELLQRRFRLPRHAARIANNSRQYGANVLEPVAWQTPHPRVSIVSRS